MIDVFICLFELLVKMQQSDVFLCLSGMSAQVSYPFKEE